MSQPSELPESVRDPLAALLAGFKKDAKPYVWSHGVGGRSEGKGKEVLWYTLPASGYAPFVPATSPLHSPYTASSSAGIPGDNPPANVGSFPFHPNITRHWPLGRASYVVVIPKNVTPLSNGLPDLSQRVASAFPGLPVMPSYTWQNWVDDVRRAMGIFQQVASADITATFSGAPYAKVPYNATLNANMPTSVQASGTYIWSAFDSTQAGPTGNGINEIILTDQPITGMAFTSMLVDPSDGTILECDVLFNVGATNMNPMAGLLRPNGAGGSTLPGEWTALIHEIGHFWGLDHTNLHPGVGFAGTITGAAAGSLSIYPPTAPAPAGPSEIPGTVGTITYMGVGYSILSQNLHPDDATALSRIYPVFLPDPTRGKYPLINLAATVRGQFRTNATGAGVFGKNVLAVPALTAGTTMATFAQRGVIAGTARLDMDPRVTSAEGLYVDNRPGANNAPYYAGASVMGQQNGTGDFSIQGLTVGGGFDATTGTPLAYDLIMEASSFLGVAPGNQSEWFNDGTFYSGNTLTTTNASSENGVLVHSTTVTPSGQPSGPVILIPNETITSLSVVAGTVIDLHPSDTNNTVISGTPFLTAASAGGFIPAAAVREQAFRPLVSIDPRFGRSAATTMTIKVRCDRAPLDLTLGSGVRIYVDGVDQTTAILGSNPPVISTNNYAEWSIPMGTIVGTTPPTQPVRVTFLAKVQTALAIDVIDNVTRLIAAWGRNDVVL